MAREGWSGERLSERRAEPQLPGGALAGCGAERSPVNADPIARGAGWSRAGGRVADLGRIRALLEREAAVGSGQSSSLVFPGCSEVHSAARSRVVGENQRHLPNVRDFE